MKNNIDIVLVEDSEYDAELAIRALSGNNKHLGVVHLRDGAAALDFLFSSNGSARKDLPRLLLLDLKMPKINGLQVLEKIKSNEVTRTIPVVVLSSSNQDTDIEACYKLGANSYVVKPVEFDCYTKTVKEVSNYWLTHNQALK